MSDNHIFTVACFKHFPHIQFNNGDEVSAKAALSQHKETRIKYNSVCMFFCLVVPSLHACRVSGTCEFAIHLHKIVTFVLELYIL